MSITFYLVMSVLLVFLGAIFTASYNDDKTKGL